jgi:hypothetical protein
MPSPRSALLLGLALALPSAGCDSKATVSGTVTLNGTKLARGYITFFPVTESGEAKGAQAETRGADIVDGAYSLENLTPGKRMVVISAPAKIVVEKAANAESTVRAIPSTSIAPATQGNSRVVDIAAGSQTVDFALQK